MVDRFTKICRFKALRSTTAPKISKAYCQEWSSPTDHRKIAHRQWAPAHCKILSRILSYPRYKERMVRRKELNKTLCSMLRHYVVDDQQKREEYLPALPYAYNRSVHLSTRKTPFDLVLSRPPPTFGTEGSQLEPSRSPSWSRQEYLRILGASISKAKSRL